MLAYVERGNVSAAQFIMDGEYDFRSEDLVVALASWKAKHLDQSTPVFSTSSAGDVGQPFASPLDECFCAGILSHGRDGLMLRSVC